MSSESSSEISEDECVEEINSTERDSIRDKISTMSFEDLQKLKERIGSKLYNQTVFGVEKKKPKKEFKRANKNRPREVSSKIRVRPEKIIASVKKVAPRDPRFDPLCGSFDDKKFKSNYKFLKEIKKKEKEKLAKELAEEEDPERRKNIKYVMQRLDNQIREQEKLEENNRKIAEEKKDVRDKLKRGEKPSYKTKSVKKIEDLVNRYEELKQKNKLQKHLEKKQKKQNHKDRRQNKELDNE